MLELINQQYDIVWSHPESSSKDWNTFLIEEVHNIQEIAQVNGRFISFTANKESGLVIEACTALKRTKFPLSAFENYFINTSFISPQSVYGWDMKKITVIQAKILALEIAKEMLQTKGVIFSQLNWSQTMHAIINSKPLPIVESERDRYRVKLMKYLSKEIKDLSKKMEAVAQTELRVHEETAQIAINDAAQLSDEKIASKCTPEELQGYADHFKQIFETSLVQRQFYIDRQLHEIKVMLFKQIDDYGSLRTHFLVETLKGIHNFITGNVYLIAGHAHLEKFFNSNYLDELYNYLKDQKNIVILRPKCLSKYLPKKLLF